METTKGMTRNEATKRANVLGGVAVNARVQGTNHVAWIVVSRDRKTVLSDDGGTW